MAEAVAFNICLLDSLVLLVFVATGSIGGNGTDWEVFLLPFLNYIFGIFSNTSPLIVCGEKHNFFYSKQFLVSALRASQHRQGQQR